MKRLGILYGLILVTLSCLSQSKEDPIYILFEDKTGGMFKLAHGDSIESYYYTIKPGIAFWYGFRPTGTTNHIKFDKYQEKIVPTLRDYNWIRHISSDYPDSLRNKNNLFIVEQVKDSIILIPVRRFVMTE